VLGVQVPPPVNRLSGDVSFPASFVCRALSAYLVDRMKSDRSSLPFLVCLLRLDSHRPAQGRLIRRTLLIVAWILVAIVCQKIFGLAYDLFGGLVATAITVLAASLGGWVATRMFQYPPIADFLIDVQTESSKVSWSTWPELQQTTIIVLTAMVAFSAYLFACDISWQFVLRWLSILNV
jgi:preprotein translocase subunit SecE